MARRGKCRSSAAPLDELVASKVDVIVAVGYPAALAAKQGTALPVVAIGQAIRLALAWSRAWRGQAATSPASRMCRRSYPKRMEFLKEMVPGLRRVAMMWNAD